MIDQLPPPTGPVPDRPRPGGQQQRGASFEEWLADSTASAGSTGEMPGGEVATSAIGESSEPTLQMASLRIELLVRDAHGNTELVAMPWQLAAGGHLAQESISAAQLLGGGAVHVPCGVQGPMVQAAGAQPSAASMTVPPVSHAGDLVTTTAFLSPARQSVAAVHEASANSNTATSTAAAVPLAVRLMRWVEQHGHDPSLWIRDYRLDEAGTRAVADAMRQLAQEQGLQLERIVVNAREVWRAATPGKENLACP